MSGHQSTADMVNNELDQFQDTNRWIHRVTR